MQTSLLYKHTKNIICFRKKGKLKSHKFLAINAFLKPFLTASSPVAFRGGRKTEKNFFLGRPKNNGKAKNREATGKLIYINRTIRAVPNLWPNEGPAEEAAVLKTSDYCFDIFEDFTNRILLIYQNNPPFVWLY